MEILYSMFNLVRHFCLYTESFNFKHFVVISTCKLLACFYKFIYQLILNMLKHSLYSIFLFWHCSIYVVQLLLDAEKSVKVHVLYVYMGAFNDTYFQVICTLYNVHVYPFSNRFHGQNRCFLASKLGEF